MTATGPAALITPACFPVPSVILRSAGPAVQAPWRDFAARQATAARRACTGLIQALPAQGPASRVALLRDAFTAITGWRHAEALASPHQDGRYGPAHAARFREPVTAASPVLVRVGDPGRYRDGATWDPATRTWTGGTETPASAVMSRYEALARQRLDEAGTDRTASRVTLPGGEAEGIALLRGAPARRAAARVAARVTARGGDASQVATGGDLVYAASPPGLEAIFTSALTVLAAGPEAAWPRAAWRLYQAPRTRRGHDAITRTFLAAAVTALHGRPPVLHPDMDLAAWVTGEGEFATWLAG